MSRVAHPAGPRHGDVLPADHPPAAPEDLNELYEGIWPRGARRSGGVLTLGGVDVRDLAAEFGTPLYVCDEEDVRSRCREYLEAFGPDGRVFYAAKAFCSRAVLRWVSEEGLGVDVCTGGELEVALSAGVPPEQITMHGNNKTLDELSRAVAAGVGHIVADSFEEIARLAYLTEGGHRTSPKVLVRVTTGVEAHTHEFMATAHDDQKFGFSLASGAADEAVRRVIACPGLAFAGLHSHIGSQIFDTAGFEVAAHRVVGLAVRIRDEHGIEIAELDLGGGFGIAYTDEDDAPEVKELAQSLREIVDGQCRAAGLARPRLTVEPGRGIVGPSTVSLYTVGTIKDVDGLRTYVSVDGGMSDNIRTALYDASYLCALASRASAAPPMLSRVVGRHCESGDIVVRHAWLPADLAPGDLLAVPATGAYCRSLASNYNHVPRPAVVAVGAGAARPIVRRETLDDLLSLDVRMNQTLPTLKIALLGCGVVGTEVARLLTEQADDSPCASAPGWSWPGSRCGGSAHRRSADDRPLAAHRGPARAGHPARRRHRGRGHRRHRAGQVAAARRAEGRQAGGHREQGAAGRERRGDLRRGPGVRGRPVLRGLGGRRHPAAAPAARVAGRGHRAPRARHRQRHHQLHPGPDGLLRRGLRRVPGGGAGARLRRGRPDRRRGGVRRGREGGHPGQPGLPHPGDRGGRAPRGHHRGHRDRHPVRPGARPGGEAAGHLRAVRAAASRSGCTPR